TRRAPGVVRGRQSLRASLAPGDLRTPAGGGHGIGPSRRRVENDLQSRDRRGGGSVLRPPKCREHWGRAVRRSRGRCPGAFDGSPIARQGGGFLLGENGRKDSTSARQGSGTNFGSERGLNLQGSGPWVENDL